MVLICGCASPTTYYTKKTQTTEVIKKINCHDYKRTSKIRQTLITETWDEVEPYNGKEYTYMENIVDESNNKMRISD